MLDFSGGSQRGISILENWQEELKRTVTTLAALQTILQLNEAEEEAIAKCRDFPLKVTRFYLSLLEPGNGEDPLRKMVIPGKNEWIQVYDEMVDPTGDTASLKHDVLNERMIHKYPDRVLLLTNALCAGHCRFCFRKRVFSEQTAPLNGENLREIVAYIKHNTGIQEVILSGGDPLMMSDDALFDILDHLRRISSHLVIRIHSRMPAWLPHRLTPDFATLLKSMKPLWFVTHFNHPREISSEAITGLIRLSEAGIPLLNQSVLLAGINDSVRVQTGLCLSLIQNGIQPYYLHHLDRALGTSRFRLTVNEGIQIMKGLRGTVPGYSIPRYMLDMPDGSGKVPLEYPYLHYENEQTIVENLDGHRQQWRD